MEKVGALGSARENTPLYVGPQPFDVLNYTIDLSLAMTSELLQGVSSITMVVRSAVDSIRLNAAASNGRLLGVIANANGTTTWRWKEDHQVATYLLCVTASKFTYRLRVGDISSTKRMVLLK